MQKVFLSLFLFFTSISTQAQEKGELPKNAFVVEAFGIGGFGSLNYERNILKKNNCSIVGRIGLSTYRIKDFNLKLNPDVIVPIALKVLYGKTHQIEVGVGQTLSSVVQADLIQKEPNRRYHFHTQFQLGYRFQSSGSRISYGVQYTPIIERQKFFNHWGGLLIGFYF